MKPMLARTLGPKFSTFPCFLQPKLNGVRALYQNGTFQSRDEKVWNTPVVVHLLAELKDKVHPTTILDGEFYRHGWKLQRINGAIAVNRQEPIEDTSEIYFCIFDIVDPTMNFSDRWLPVMHQIVNLRLPHIHAVQTELLYLHEEIDLHFRQATALGFEGVMIRPNGPYEFGERMSDRVGHMTQYRSPFLWKKKQWEDDEFVCIGVTQGEGKASIGIGALICAAHPEKCPPVPTAQLGRYHDFNVGTGFDDSERIEFAKNPPLGKLIRVRYLELSADGIPLNPSFLCVMP